MPEIKENFFRGKPAQNTLPVIQWSNDPEYRASYGRWLYQNFDELAREFKQHGRWLTLKELEQPLEFSDLPQPK